MANFTFILVSYGSSSMTVNEVSSRDQVTCAWFDYDKSPLRYEKKLPFHVLSSLLVPVEEFDPRVGDFIVGDVVSLRSDSLFMTVLGICLWLPAGNQPLSE